MNTLYAAFENLRQFIPGWAEALLVLLIGWGVAIGMRQLVSKILNLFQFNRLCERTGISEFLKKGEAHYSPTQLVGVGIYWAVLLLTFFQMSVFLETNVMETFARQIAINFPKILGALLIAAIGLVGVSFIAKFLRTLARNAGMPYANLLSKIVKWLGVIFVIAIAVDQIQLGSTIIGATFQILLAAIAFGAALAFGLGCKDMARSAMEKFLLNLREKHRDDKGSDLEG